MFARLALVSLVLLVGCNSAAIMAHDLTTTNTTCGVSVVTPMVGTGRGAIVGPRTVWTVSHVVGDSTVTLVENRPASVLSRDLTNDGIAILHIDAGPDFDASRIVPTGSMDAPVTFLPERGPQDWPYGIIRGDSGSPVLDSKGRLVGVVRATQGYYAR